MEQPLYTAVKVNNEIELCEISDLECKLLIAENLVRSVCDEKGYPVKFLMRRAQNEYL